MQILLCCDFYVHMFFWGMDQENPLPSLQRTLHGGWPLWNCIKVAESIAEVVSLRIFEASFGGIFFLVLKPSSTETPHVFLLQWLWEFTYGCFFPQKRKMINWFWKNRIFFPLPVFQFPFLATKTIGPPKKMAHRWRKVPEADHLAGWGCKVVVVVGETFGVWNITRRGTADITRWWQLKYFSFSTLPGEDSDFD